MAASTDKRDKTPSAFGGAMIIAGTAIGAGMLALPIITAGMWYVWAMVTIMIVWGAMYTSGLFILEANLHYPEGAHLGTLAKDCLPFWLRFINDLSLIFVLYILTYAYITIGSPFLNEVIHVVNPELSLTPITQKISYIVIFGGMVMISTLVVDRITTIIVIAMALTFFLAIPSLVANISMASLFNTSQENARYLPYLLGGTTAFVASFGYHGNVSSLVKYYNKDHNKVKASLFWGTFIVMATYVIWITSTHGAISRTTFKIEIINQKEPVDALIAFISNPILMTWFKNFAILSSFLGVTLGLFDYIADQLKFGATMKGRFITALITYIPPMIIAIIFPYGFIYAISYAGFFATFWALTIPAILVYKTRKKFESARYQVWGGNFLIILIIIFSTIVALSELLALFNILPKY